MSAGKKSAASRAEHKIREKLLELKDEFADFQSFNAFVIHAMGVMLKSDLPCDPSIASGAQVCSDLSRNKADEIAKRIGKLHEIAKNNRGQQ